MLPGLYVHVPFCRGKCPYCGFYSIPSPIPITAWLRGLEKEILLTQNHFDLFDSLYLGGGTPSFLSDGDLEEVMRLIFDHYAFASDVEVTLETNPSDITRNRSGFFRSLGINRIHVGVQSFNDRILQFLGRRHTSKEAVKAIGHLRGAGFQNIGLDLIYGLGNQPMKTWVQTLEKALSFEPEHLSCYQLTLEKGSVFNRRYREKPGIILPEKTAAAHFLATASFLENKGYRHYEVSNFAVHTQFESRHNRKYWRHTPYLGLGPSAHSFDGKSRRWNVGSVRKYCKILNEMKLPVEGTETLNQEQLHLESLMLGLRTRRGVILDTLPPASVEVLFTMQEQGFLNIKNGRAVPTKRGYLMADHLPVWISAEDPP